MEIMIITDSSSDLSLGYAKKHEKHLEVLGIPVSVGDQEFIDDLGEQFSHEIFYGEMKKGVLPKTSQINVMTFCECFERHLEQGKDILYIGLTSGLSGTFNNAFIAKEMALEKYPNGKIEIVESVAASIGLAVIIHKLVYKVEEEGMDLSSLVTYVEKEKLRANHWFVVDDLIHLKNGGRIPAAIAYVGSMLNVKPLLSMDYEGKLMTFSKTRGKVKACKFIIEKIETHLENSDELVIIGHANAPEDAQYIVDELKKKQRQNKVEVTCLSATIASHVGPGMLAVAFMGTENREKK